MSISSRRAAVALSGLALFAHRGFALPLAALLAFAGIARADTTLEFSTSSGNPNNTGSSITAGYGSNAPGTPDVTVGYSPYLYNFPSGYGGLGGGTGDAVYSDNSNNYGGGACQLLRATLMAQNRQ